MSKRLGEALIERGQLTRAQLDKALQRQLISGGHLGTSLIELGFVGEVALGKMLGEILGVRCAPREMFMDIPPTIIDTVPIELVRKRRAIPVGLEGRALHLAVIDPSNLAGLSTSTGYKVQPYVAPEIRIIEAMERYYGIPRPARYVRVSSIERGDKQRESRKKPRREPELVRCRETDATIRELSARLSEVQNHGELGDVIIDYAARQMDRCILFEVGPDGARPVNWQGSGLEAGRLGDATVPISTDSIFGLALGDRCFHGTLPNGADPGGFFSSLGMDAPGECLILPIYGEERLEAVLYGDSGLEGKIAGSTDLYLDLLERIGICLEMLRCKRRLQAG